MLVVILNIDVGVNAMSVHINNSASTLRLFVMSVNKTVIFVDVRKMLKW